MTLRLAQLGTWHLHAAHHVEAARANPQTDVVVVWDSRPGAAEEFGAAHELPFETDLATVLGRDDIDGVIVDTATTAHLDVITAALEAGKHVFSEKVLATSSDDAAALIALAAEWNLVLDVSFPMLASAPAQTIRRLIDDGAVGQVTGSRIRWAHHGAVGTPWIPKHFFSLADTGGGALIDLGAHPIYLSGLIHGSAPTSVVATTSYVTDREVEDNAVAVLSYASGAFSVAEMSMVSNFFGFSIEVTGTVGSIAVGPTDTRVLLRTGQAGEWIEQPLDAALADPFDQWVDAVVAGAPDPQHLITALDVTRVIEAGYESSRTGASVSLAS